MKAQIEIVTPTLAKSLLERNTMNRKVSTTTVERYAADMRNNRWNNNGQGIVVSLDGELLDGQHRMHAIIASQQSIAMLVVRGAAKESFVTMDTGKPRSLSDLLSIQGYVHTNTLAGAARSAYNYIAGVTQGYAPTKATLDSFIQANPYAQEASSLVAGCSKINQRIQFSSVMFLGNYRGNLNDEVQTFLEGVNYGEGMVRGDPRHTLREWIVAERLRGRGYLKADATFAAVCRAWNAWAAGKELAVIKGVAKPTLMSISLFGFERGDFADVPDLAERAKETAMANLKQQQLRYPKPTIAKASPYFGIAAR